MSEHPLVGKRIVRVSDDGIHLDNGMFVSVTKKELRYHEENK